MSNENQKSIFKKWWYRLSKVIFIFLIFVSTLLSISLGISSSNSFQKSQDLRDFKNLYLKVDIDPGNYTAQELQSRQQGYMNMMPENIAKAEKITFLEINPIINFLIIFISSLIISGIILFIVRYIFFYIAIGRTKLF